MNHFLLMLICIFSVEIFYFFNFSKKVISILSFSKKVTSVIISKKISDHWKEKIVPFYAIKIMKISIILLFIFSVIISILFFVSIFKKNFYIFVISIYGIVESVIFVIIYLILKKFFFIK